MAQPTAAVVDLVTTLWPGVDIDAANIHHGASQVVIVVPGQMTVRVARTADGDEELRRAAPLLSSLAAAGLPFAVPEPLSTVMYHGGMTAVATTVVPGKPRPASVPPPQDPGLIRTLLQAIAGVSVTGLPSVLSGRPASPAWAEDARRYLLPLMPPAQARQIEARIDAALDVLELVRPQLVHGNLTGASVHWDGDCIVGVVNWNLAFIGDPAYDVAQLADTFDWATLTAAVGETTAARAHRYRDVFLIESYLAALSRGAVGDAAGVLDRLRRQLSHDTSAPSTCAPARC